MRQNSRLIVIIWVFFSSSVGFTGWINQTVDTEGQVGKYSSIALDNQNHAHISYWDEGNLFLKYANDTSGSWSIDTVDRDGYVFGYTSLILDNTGNPCISYYRYYLGYSAVFYANWDGTTWTKTPVDGADGFGVGEYSSLGLDETNYAHISYFNEASSNLKYAQWSGSAWQIENVDTPGNVGEYTSLALDSFQYPHISYYDATNGSLKYAYWDGSGWVFQTVDSGGVGKWTSLVLDGNNYPHISYYDYTNSDLKYAYYNGSGWAIQTVEGYGSVGSYSALALDASNNAHISYYSESNHILKYAHWTGSTWSIQNADISANVGRYTSIALDSGGKPHISYFDVSNNALKYSYRQDGIEVEDFQFSARPDSAGIALRWHATNEPTSFNLFRSRGESVRLGAMKKMVLLNPIPITGSGFLTYLDLKVEDGMDYSYFLEAIDGSGSKTYTGPKTAQARINSAQDFELQSIAPNPAHQGCTIFFQRSSKDTVNLFIYDICGHLVRSYALNSGTESAQVWDLNDGCGNPVANGVYIVLLAQGSHIGTKRLIVNR